MLYKFSGLGLRRGFLALPQGRACVRSLGLDVLLILRVMIICETKRTKQDDIYSTTIIDFFNYPNNLIILVANCLLRNRACTVHSVYTCHFAEQHLLML